MPAEDIAAFWSKFEDLEGPLGALGPMNWPVYHELLKALHQVNTGLYLEIGRESAPKDLFVTAEGRVSLFPLAEQVVAEAPDFPGWAISALKPRLGFPEKTEWEGLEIDLTKVRFEARRNKSNGEIGLFLATTGYTDGQRRSVHNGLLRALDHGLGERFFAERVRGVFVELVAEEELATKGLPLDELYYLLNEFA